MSSNNNNWVLGEPAASYDITDPLDHSCPDCGQAMIDCECDYVSDGDDDELLPSDEQLFKAVEDYGVDPDDFIEAYMITADFDLAIAYCHDMRK